MFVNGNWGLGMWWRWVGRKLEGSYCKRVAGLVLNWVDGWQNCHDEREPDFLGAR